MFLKVVLVVVISIFVSVECGGSQVSYPRKGRYVVFKGPGWINKIRKCAFAGDQTTDPSFKIGTLESAGLKYDDINQKNTFVSVLGKFETKTIRTSYLGFLDAVLNRYVQKNDYKQFSIYERQAASSMGNQITALHLKLTFYKTGSIELSTYLYAGAWGLTTSCAVAGSEINEVLLRIYDQ